MGAQIGKSNRPQDYFAAHPVFTHAEYSVAQKGAGRSAHSVYGALRHGVATGRLIRIRQGVYATTPLGADPASFGPDPYLLATKLRADAVVAFHSALEFHGKAYSVWHRVQFLTAARPRPFAWRGIQYVGVQAPLAVRGLPAFGGGILLRPHAGGMVRVASLERCVVDLLHSPEHGGGWEEIFRSLTMIEYLDLTLVIGLALQMGSALTVGRVGFLLERQREPWMVEETHLAGLEQHAPSQATYLDRRREPGRLIPRWNLVVPRTCCRSAGGSRSEA